MLGLLTQAAIGLAVLGVIAVGIIMAMLAHPDVQEPQTHKWEDEHGNKDNPFITDLSEGAEETESEDFKYHV